MHSEYRVLIKYCAFSQEFSQVCHLSISPHRHCQRVDANEVRCTESLDEILKPAISLASYRTGSILPGNNNMEAMPLDDPQTTPWWGRDPPGGGGSHSTATNQASQIEFNDRGWTLFSLMFSPVKLNETQQN